MGLSSMRLSSKGMYVGVSLLTAGLMASVAGSIALADPLEVRAKIDKILSGDRIRIEISQAEAVKVGDKVRLEIKDADGATIPIKTRWTVKRVDGTVLIASPDGEPTQSPVEGGEAVILTSKASKTVAENPAPQSVEDKEEAASVEAPVAEDSQDQPVQTAAPTTSTQQKPPETGPQNGESQPVADTSSPNTSTPDTSPPSTSASVEATGTQMPQSSDAADPQTDPAPEKAEAVEAIPPKASETVTQSTSVSGDTKPQDDQAEAARSEAPAEKKSDETMTADAGPEKPDEQEQKTATAESETPLASDQKPDPQDAKAAVEDTKPAVMDRASSEAVTQCDRLAAHPFDLDAIAPGVAYKELNARKTIEACETAIKDFPDVARFYGQLTRGLHKDGQLKAAFDATKKGAELGSAHSMAYLGVMYRQGTTVKKDATEALRWLEKAAEAGNPGGMVFAAAMYRDGIGSKRNIARAAELYLMASDKGVAEANTNLAVFYDRGSGVKKDAVKSAHFMLEAYGAEDKSALRILNDSSTVLSVATRKAIQQQLRELGFYRGGIDGQLGAKSRAALSLFAKERKTTPVQKAPEE